MVPSSLTQEITHMVLVEVEAIPAVVDLSMVVLQVEEVPHIRVAEGVARITISEAEVLVEVDENITKQD